MLVVSPLYYGLASLTTSLGRLCVVVIAMTLLIIGALRYAFRLKQFDANEKSIGMRTLRYGYIGFIMATILVGVVVPTLAITKKVGNNIFHRTTFYEEIQLREALDVALRDRQSQIERLCGKEALQQGYGYANGCDTVSDDLKYLLENPTDVINKSGCENLGYRIFCRDDENPGHPHREIRFIDPVLRWLSPFWELPVLLETLSFTKESAKPQVKINGDTTVHLSHRYPWLYRLVMTDLAFILIIGLSALLIGAAIYFLAMKLLGINVPKSYRSCRLKLKKKDWEDFTNGKLEGQTGSGPGFADLVAAMEDDKAHKGILIRPGLGRDKDVMSIVHNPVLVGENMLRPIDVGVLAGDRGALQELTRKLDMLSGERATLVLENFESIAFNSDKRLRLLESLESYIAENLSLVILCDVAPLYMLTNQSRYIPNSMEDEFADAQELVRWSRLLSQFDKYYDWSPMDLDFVDCNRWERTVLREVSAWPELFPLKDVIESIGPKEINKAQVLQFVSTHAGPAYRRRWNFCTKEEKLLLYQLAKGLFINPANVEPLEHLMRRGFVRRDPGWKIVNESFARFVLTAEREEVYSKWVTASEQGLWKVLRIPLVTAAAVIIGILIFSAQEAIESFLALAASVLALVPLLLRNVSLIRGASSPPPES